MSDDRRFICLAVDVDSLEAAQAQVFAPEFKSLSPKDLIEVLAEKDYCDVQSIWEYTAYPADKMLTLVEAFMEFAKLEREQREDGDLP